MNHDFPPESLMQTAKGRFIVTLTDASTGEVLTHWDRPQIITRDAGILAGILFKNNMARNGLNMLAVGTGATGNILSPDAPDNRQRKLNTEIFRKAFSSTTFRNNAGVAVAYPTNIVDFTTTFAAGEANGPLNEMGLVSAFAPPGSTPIAPAPVFPAYDPTVDLSSVDILVNYLTFGVLVKSPATVLTVTWRLTF